MTIRSGRRLRMRTRCDSFSRCPGTISLMTHRYHVHVRLYVTHDVNTRAAADDGLWPLMFRSTGSLHFNDQVLSRDEHVLLTLP